jgi:hypothetical protein
VHEPGRTDSEETTVTTFRRTAPVLLSAAALLAAAGCGPAGPAAAGPVVGPPLTSAAAAPTPAADAGAEEEEEEAGSAVCGPDEVTGEADEDAPQPAGSTRGTSVVLYNSSTTDCTLAAEPGIELLDGAGAPLPTTVEFEEPLGTAVDVVPAEFSVGLTLQWRVVPTSPDADPATDCPTAAALRLTLTPGADPVDVPVGITACDAGTLYVTRPALNAG